MYLAFSYIYTHHMNIWHAVRDRQELMRPLKNFALSYIYTIQKQKIRPASQSHKDKTGTKQHKAATSRSTAKMKREV